MARKSRKNLPQPEQAAASMLLPELEEAKMPAAIYGRLSVEDEEKEESMETQIALVQDYINRSSELSYVDTYFDNGFTGTNFKRPAFTRLMNDVRQKKIKCIVVKDLSRFGRNYLEAGYYIETVFPFLGIRLIAVTDNFDSTRKEDMESLALPIRNMVNAMYAKDISKKIWTSLQRKKEAGYAVGNDAPYGYIRNSVTKRNEIDPEAAFYVQLIFQWELMGVPIFEIARRMTLLQVPTPREWHRKMVEGKEVLTCKKWGVTTIRHILENQTYVGDTINNKSTQKLFAGQDKHDLPKEQWYVAKNTHPAIIARDDFEKVQKILNKNRAVFKTVRAKSEQIRAEYQNDLAGMVFCADCGRPMEFERLPHSLYGDIQKEEQDLKEAHKKANRRKTLMEQELKNLKGEKMRMYEEYAAGTLPLDTYKQKKQECDRRISEVEEKIELEKGVESTRSAVPGTVRAAAEQAENFLHGTRLTAGMVSAFIENVFVHDGGRIVVRFKYEQSIQDTVKALQTG